MRTNTKVVNKERTFEGAFAAKIGNEQQLERLVASCLLTFSNSLIGLKADRGLSLVERIDKSQIHGGTELIRSVRESNQFYGPVDRVICLTDEQAGADHYSLAKPNAKVGYMINVGSEKPALQLSGGWTRINGFSERIVDYIRLEEGLSSDNFREME